MRDTTISSVCNRLRVLPLARIIDEDPAQALPYTTWVNSSFILSSLA